MVESLEVGGLEKLLVEFARHHDRDRFAPACVALGKPGRLAADVVALGWRVDALDARPGLKPSAVLRLARLLRAGRVGIVHTHSEGPLLYGAAAATLARVPRVLHTRHHGPDLGSSPRQLRLLTAATRWVDRVVCVAEDGARHCVAEGVAASKVVTVRNGIDLDRFAFHGPTPGGPAVIVGRLAPEKDHATLLRAAAVAARRRPDFRLEIAGDGPCEPALRALAAELDLGGTVRFLGRVDDVPALLARAGLLVLSSRLEGISLTLLEAMASGLPVVATRVGGNPEVVDDGRTGRLVPPASPEALAAAMLDLQGDPDTSLAMGRAGRARAERHFDVRRMVATYERLYDDPRTDADTLARAGEPAEVCPA